MSWSKKYKKSIDCSNPKGFSQKAHCAGRKARQGGKDTKSKSVSEMNLSQLKEEVRNILRERSVKAIQKDYSNVVSDMEKHLELYKKSKGTPEEKKHIQHLKSLTDKKKSLQKELDLAVAGLYKNAELKVDEAITNPKKSNPNDLATTVIGWYDFATDYIDDGGQRRTAEKQNKYTLDWFASHPSDVKQKAFKVMISKQPSLKSKIERIFGSSLKESVNEEILKPGTKVKVQHKGKTVSGKIVRYDSKTPGSPFYIVYTGQYDSIEVPAYQVKKESVNEGKLSISQLPFEFLFNYPIGGTSKPGNLEDWIRDGMKLKKGRIEKFSPADDKKLRSLINTWWDEYDDVSIADFNSGRDSKEIKKVKKDILDFLKQKSNVISESVNEAKTYKKGDKLKIKLPNGKKFDVVFDSYSRTKGVALGKFKDSHGEYDIKPFDLKSIVESVNEATEPEIISQLKDIVKNKQYQSVKDPKTGKKVKVDMQTANAVLKIYNGLSNVNKQRMLEMDLPKMIEVSLKIINKYK